MSAHNWLERLTEISDLYQLNFPNLPRRSGGKMSPCRVVWQGLSLCCTRFPRTSPAENTFPFYSIIELDLEGEEIGESGRKQFADARRIHQVTPVSTVLDASQWFTTLNIQSREVITQCCDSSSPLSPSPETVTGHCFCADLSYRPARSKIWVHCPALQNRTGRPAGPTLLLSHIRCVVLYHANMNPSLPFRQVRFYSFHMWISLPTVF